jgi:hypothetical protein
VLPRFSLLVALVLCLFYTSAIAEGEPTLTISEPALGSWQFTGTANPPVGAATAPGTALEFSWLAAVGDCQAIADYRYGWDVIDVNDDNDPGWSSWGSILAAPPQTFWAGTHTFTAEVRDACGGKSRGTVQVTVEDPISTEASTWGAIKALYR